MASYAMTAWYDRVWYVHILDLDRTVKDEQLDKAMQKAGRIVNGAHVRSMKGGSRRY